MISLSILKIIFKTHHYHLTNYDTSFNLSLAELNKIKSMTSNQINVGPRKTFKIKK